MRRILNEFKSLLLIVVSLFRRCAVFFAGGSRFGSQEWPQIFARLLSFRVALSSFKLTRETEHWWREEGKWAFQTLNSSEFIF